ncbi:helix-turn-helix transcriptional regulator [Lysobacter sp. K5869]|uniref:winged helix-turn-helix transcriptional regulator n=1 Tax=Lysobacter sp. K5869 TaxID=2820808 RepID=UPI001C05F64E|nr:helix-turn-helix domain-containing protein [Lysobacter sp. K5869]QWP75920.1 helix-turn-helix transcriptional regulator [Lysobacter sp. K5869]
MTNRPHDVESVDCKKAGQVLARVGEKWSVFIIMSLAEKPHRFTELKRALNGISQRMLTLCLRGLERDGLIQRTVIAVMPPHVEYALTPLGISLTKPIIALGQWAFEHIPDIDAARAAFEARENGEKT